MFRWILATALALSVLFCAAAAFVARARLADQRDEIDTQKLELERVRSLVQEIEEYQKAKDELQRRIDVINSLKQNQTGPSRAVSALAGLGKDTTDIESAAVVDARTLVINTHNGPRRIAAE